MSNVSWTKVLYICGTAQEENHLSFPCHLLLFLPSLFREYSFENVHFTKHTNKRNHEFPIICLKQQSKGCCSIFPQDRVTDKWSDLLEHSWNPDQHFLRLLTCNSYQDWGQDKQRETLQPWTSVEGHSPQSSVVEPHPWNTSNAAVLGSSSQHSKPTYWWLSNCLSCSLLGITHSCPVTQAKHKHQFVIRKKPRTTVCVGKIKFPKVPLKQERAWGKQARVWRRPQLRFRAAMGIEV